MNVITESAERVSLQLNPTELVGLYGCLYVALKFHESELHTLTSLKPEEAKSLLAELRPVIDRMKSARIDAGLPW